MAKTDYSITIAIDTKNSAFHFYSMPGGNNSPAKHIVKGYSGACFDDAFFTKFKDAIKSFTAENPAEGIRKVAVILPDNAVLTDTIKIPQMKKLGQTKKTLDATLGGLYKNFDDLHITANVVAQNKQYVTYFIVAVKKYIVKSIYTACSENKLLVDTLTFESNSELCGATVIDGKLKNKSYLFLDIKNDCSKFIFSFSGKAVGSYPLPFGLEFLRKSAVIPEDMLFDHSFAEISVINAKEKAKSKKLSVLAVDTITDDESDETADDGEQTDSTEQVENAEALPEQKVFRKKMRKLPKFMQREIPDTAEGVLYENFRIFVKWALTLIRDNDKLTEIGKPDFVCVNIPSDLSPVIDTVNEEKDDNGILFRPLHIGETDGSITANLEFYGGLFPKVISKTGKF